MFCRSVHHFESPKETLRDKHHLDQTHSCIEIQSLDFNSYPHHSYTEIESKHFWSRPTKLPLGKVT